MSKRSPICHVEWRSKDANRLKEFYRAVFHWKLSEPMPGYSVADTGSEELRAGFMQIEEGSSVAPTVVNFIAAEDLEGAESAIREAGGQVQASAQSVPGMGRFSIFTDPDGNQLALWQSEASAHKAAKKARKHAEKADRERERAARKQAAAEEKARKKAEKHARHAAEGGASSGEKSDKADVVQAVESKASKKKDKDFEKKVKADKKSDKKAKQAESDGDGL